MVFPHYFRCPCWLSINKDGGHINSFRWVSPLAWSQALHNAHSCNCLLSCHQMPALFCVYAHARDFPRHTGLGHFASTPSIIPAGWRTQAHSFSSDGEDHPCLSSSRPCRPSPAFQIFPQRSFAGLLAGRHKSILTLPSQLGPSLQTRVSRGSLGQACLWRGHAGGLGPGLRPSPASTCRSLAPSVRGGHALWLGLCRQVF